MVVGKKIKIAYIIDTLNIGGTENQLIKQIELLSEKGYEQYLFCLRSSHYLTQNEHSFPIVNLNVNSLISINGIKKIIRMSKLLKRNKIDIVQAYFIDSNIFGVLAAKIAGVKKIITCRRDMGFWYNRKVLFAMRIVNILSDRILVNSYSIKRNVITYENANPDKIDVIYNGIDFSKFGNVPVSKTLKYDLDIPDNCFVVGIVANLNRKVKRVDLFLKMAKAILKINPEVFFIVVGGGYLEQSLRDLSTKLGLNSNLIFTGQQINVLKFLHIFDVGVLTSESEGFSNSIIEYMASGLPVVCFDSGGNKELVENYKNGFLVEYDQYRAMANSVTKLHKNNGLLNVIKKSNLEKVKTFSWEKVSEILDTYYKNMTIENKV